jgi:hypothetical protein
MAIDLSSETPIPFKEAAGHRLLRNKSRDRRAVNFSTILRWHLKGVRGIKLEGIRVGATLCTTEGAICRFIERLSTPGFQSASVTASTVAQAHNSDQKRLSRVGL